MPAIGIGVILAFVGVPMALSLFSSFPGPLSIADAAVRYGSSGSLWLDLGSSTLRWGMGFLVGGAMGIVLGIVTGSSVDVGRSSVGVMLNVLRAIPVVGLPPLLLLVLGINELAKVFIVAWGCVFPVWLATQRAAVSMRSTHLLAAKCLELEWRERVWRVELPAIAHGAYGGLRISIAVGWICVVAAEWLSGVDGTWHAAGFGFRLWRSGDVNDVPLCVFLLMVFGTLGLLSDWLFRLLVDTGCPRVCGFDASRG